MILDEYKDHDSVLALAILQNPEQVLDTFKFQEINKKEVAQLLKSLDGRISIGEDKIAPKLVSLAANEFTNTSSTAINCSTRNSRFPYDAKRRQLLDKGKLDRTVERNQWRPCWGGGQGAIAPSEHFEGAAELQKGAKNFMKFDGSIPFFQHRVAGHNGGPCRSI